MDFNGIKEVIDRIDSSTLSYFEYKTKDGHIKMDKSLTRPINGEKVSSNNAIVKDKIEENDEVIIENTSTDKNEKEESVEGLKIVTAPMVGTFYSSQGPDKSPFVSVGDEVKKGSTLCIIEAMKLMNEIESDYSGIVKEILVEDGVMVEYGQPLFKIKEN